MGKLKSTFGKLLFITLLAACPYTLSAEGRYFELEDSHGDKFTLQIRNPRKIRLAERIASGRTHRIVTGRINKRAVGYNPNWSFHVAPSSIGFTQMAIEVCDSAIFYVEENLDEVGGAFLPKNIWCPWSGYITREIKR